MAKIEHIKNKRGEVIYPISKEGAISDENGVLLSTKIATFITRLVDNLANYYLKSETYTKGEVDNLIGAIQGFTYIVVSELPTASAETMGIVYLVPSGDPQAQNVKDEYITIRSGVEGSYTYSWEQIGSTAIDLSGYVTTETLNAALANYTTTANLTTLLAAKQDTIADLSTIRSGAAAGATAYQKPGTGIPKSDTASDVQTSLGKADTAYQKPSGGIPKSDLASGVQDSLDLADTAIQADPIGTIVPPVDPSEFATQEEVSQLSAEVTDLDIRVGEGQEQNYIAGYLDNTGAVIDSEDYIITDFIPYSNNQEIVWYNGLSEVASVYLWAYDSNKQPISEQYYKANTVPSRTLRVNVSSVSYIRASMSATNPNVRVDVDGTTVWTRKEQIVGIQSEIGALSEGLNAVPELIDEKIIEELGSETTLYAAGTYPNFEDSYIYYTTGVAYPSTVNKSTDFIEIAGDIIETIMTVTTTAVDTGLAFYNASKTYISGVSQNIGSEISFEKRVIPIPEGAKYIRTTIRNAYTSSWYLKVSRVGAYEPKAESVEYDNTLSGLSSNTVQGALDELSASRKQFTQRIPLFLGQVYQGRPLINNTTLANRNNYAYSQLIKNNGTLVSAPNGSTFACFKNDTWYIDSATIPSDCEYFRIVVSNSGNEKPYPIDVTYRNADGYLTILKETYRQGENYPTLFNWFTCDVAFPIDNPETDIEDATPLFTTAWIKLPASYSRYGTPTKMIILCHGTSGFLWDSFVETYRTPVEYFNAQGYAVLDCFPLSSLYASYSPERIAAHSLGAACYKAAYDYAVTHFNVEKEVCIYAKSGGGISQATIVNFSGIPVKAASILCPNLDLFNDFRCMEPKSSVNRMSIFNLTPIETSGAWTSADDAVLKANQDKFSGFSPILFHSTIDAMAYNNYLLDRSYPLAGTITKAYSQNLLNDSDFSAICDNAKLFTKVPVKIWYAEDDNQVPYVTILKYQKMVQNGGGVCILRQMPDNTGGHGSADTSDQAEKITVTARDGREMTIAVGIVEALQWIELFI